MLRTPDSKTYSVQSLAPKRNGFRVKGKAPPHTPNNDFVLVYDTAWCTLMGLITFGGRWFLRLGKGLFFAALTYKPPLGVRSGEFMDLTCPVMSHNDFRRGVCCTTDHPRPYNRPHHPPPPAPNAKNSCSGVNVGGWEYFRIVGVSTIVHRSRRLIWRCYGHKRDM